MPRLARRRILSANVLAPVQPQRRQHVLTRLLKLCLYATILFTISSTLLARYEIEQISMEPNFRPGQRVIVSQAGRAFGGWISGSAHAAHAGSSATWLKRGQIIIFYETDDRNRPPMIKRLIGLPGDQVAIHDGSVFINNARLPEPYLSASTECTTYCSLTLGADEYFLMGDNRPVSRDSRLFGPIRSSHMVGQVIVRFWPLEQLELFL